MKINTKIKILLGHHPRSNGEGQGKKNEQCKFMSEAGFLMKYFVVANPRYCPIPSHGQWMAGREVYNSQRASWWPASPRNSNCRYAAGNHRNGQAAELSKEGTSSPRPSRLRQPERGPECSASGPGACSLQNRVSATSLNTPS